MLLNFLKPAVGFIAHLAHPSGRAVLQFGMVFVLPCSLSGMQSIALLATLDFVAGDLREESTPSALADKFVDIGNEVNR